MTEVLRVKGGVPLKGEVSVRGSKNAAPKLMIASLLSDKPSTIEGVPRSVEIEITKELCERIGARVTAQKESVFVIETRKIQHARIPELSRRNRIPILAIGPLLHRAGIAEVPVLGGCPIGHRPINFHIAALEKMGARFRRLKNSYYAEAKELHGAEILLPYPSVGATENVLLAAVKARGTTVLLNAAVEPEILNLVSMLKAMGAEISVDLELRKFEIKGVSNLDGATIRVIPDRSEIVSFAAAALATDGDILVTGAGINAIDAFLSALSRIGARFELTDRGIRFSGRRPYRATTIETAPHPAFMTDWQQPFSVLLTQNEGESIIHETVYEDRFGYTKDLNRMGARIEVSDACGGAPCRFEGRGFLHSARIEGPTPLTGADITMTDIRAGMAYLIAALAAEGTSTIHGVEHLDRGYEKLDERLRALGADIQRVKI